MIRPSTIAALAALVAVASIVACTANVGPSEPSAGLRSPAKYADHFVSASPTFEDYTGTNTTTEPAEPDAAKITSAVNAPPPTTRTKTPAPEPATPSGATETNLYVYQLRALLGDPDMPAVDAIGLAMYVCETAIPAGGGVEGAAEHMQRVADKPVSLLQARSVVLQAVQYRCPASA